MPKIKSMFAFICIVTLMQINGQPNGEKIEPSAIFNNKLGKDMFIQTCYSFNKYLKFYVGNCPMLYENFHDTIQSVVDTIASVEPSLTIDDLLRKHLFVNTTDFFRNEYKTEPEYLKSLDGEY